MNASEPQRVDLASVTLAPGFRLPFYPMRPRTGRRIRTVDDIDAIISDEDEYDFTLKLNGDRACVAVLDGDVAVQNRHGSWYKMMVSNLDKFKALSGAWMFDGEIYKKQFLPFEAIIVAGKSVASCCPSYRKMVAMETSAKLGISWVYGVDTQDFKTVAATMIGKQNPEFEGIVGKKKGTSYVPLGTATQQSVGWVKFKWI